MVCSSIHVTKALVIVIYHMVGTDDNLTAYRCITLFILCLIITKVITEDAREIHAIKDVSVTFNGRILIEQKLAKANSIKTIQPRNNSQWDFKRVKEEFMYWFISIVVRSLILGHSLNKSLNKFRIAVNMIRSSHYFSLIIILSIILETKTCFLSLQQQMLSVSLSVTLLIVLFWM